MPTACLAARCSAEHHLVATRRKLHFKTKIHGLHKRWIAGAAAGRVHIALGSLLRWKMEESITQLDLKLEVRAPQQSLYKTHVFLPNSALWGLSEASAAALK